MKIKLSWLFAILLSGCGDGSQIKDAVTERLRDPDSAKFGELVVSEAGDRACIEYNAKNGYGGYGQASIAELWKFDGAWRVTEMEGSHHNCTEIEFQADVAGLQASGEASGNALDQLSVLGKFSSDEEKFAASRGEGGMW